jgi:hypothetical protein
MLGTHNAIGNDNLANIKIDENEMKLNLNERLREVRENQT